MFGMIRIFPFFLVFMLGCGTGPHSRVMDLVGAQAFERQQAGLETMAWPPLQLKKIGLMVHSDSTGPSAAPAISSAHLATLTNRTEVFMAEQCSLSDFVPMTFPAATNREQIQQELISQGQRHEVSHLVLVVLSSREHSGPVALGEERMMTQMHGIAIENTALAEVVLVRLSDFTVMSYISGLATEVLEQLDAPIGDVPSSKVESLEILRAQAGQQALDHALDRRNLLEEIIGACPR